MPTKRDIIFLLSGGESNQDINKSLGGPPSTSVIRDFKNNLFNDIKKEDIGSGYTDYCCFYIKNQSSSDWQDVTATKGGEVPSDISILIGTENENEIQQFNIISNNGATGGYFTLKVDGVSGIRVDYDADIDVWADNFKNALIGAEVFSDIVVEGQYYSDMSTSYFQNKTFQIFQIVFQGVDGNRNQSIISLDEDHLTVDSGDEITITSVEIQKGSPANTVARQITKSTDIPPNITFGSSVSLGAIKGGEVVPVWLKRTISVLSDAVDNVKFQVKVKGKTPLFVT